LKKFTYRAPSNEKFHKLWSFDKESSSHHLMRFNQNPRKDEDQVHNYHNNL